MKRKHPHLADAEFAKLSLQLQISCDICNKLPVMRGTAHPQRNSQLNFFYQLQTLTPSEFRKCTSRPGGKAFEIEAVTHSWTLV